MFKVVIGFWFLASLLFALSGAIADIPQLLIPLLIWGPTIVGVGWLGGQARLQKMANTRWIKMVLMYHGFIRIFFGCFFLYDHALGNLNPAFAYPAGVGDILAGIFAFILIAMQRTQNTKWLLAWNAFAFVDIVFVFLNAQRLIFIEKDQQFFENFINLPYPMLPTFVVPMILITHLLVFKMLWCIHKNTITMKTTT